MDWITYRRWGDKKFYKFEELQITDQALLATKQCLSPDEFSFFKFDKEDMKLWKEVILQESAGVISTLLMLAVDVVIVRWKTGYKNKGPLQQALASFALVTPIALFNYYMINNKYQDLKKHLVFKYLVDENFDKLY